MTGKKKTTTTIFSFRYPNKIAKKLEYDRGKKKTTTTTIFSFRYPNKIAKNLEYDRKKKEKKGIFSFVLMLCL
jgi:hypothetical protein